MNLLLLERAELTLAGEVTLRDHRAAHLLDVLHVSAGQEIRIGIVDGPYGRGRVLDLAERSVRLQCEVDDRVPDRPRVDLLLAVPRPKVMRRLWAQLAALGVGRVILTNAERVERPYFDTHWLEPATYRPLLIEGLQQARDTRIPLVSIHRRLKVLVEDELDGMCGDATRVVAHPGVTARFHDIATTGRHPRVLLAVGPEGGWNRFELDLLERHRFTPMALGERTLRTDTACVALLTLVHDGLSARTSADP
jgi:16S rRNA (uracil1498-N3)-methyltransferase